jgi:pantoate--beta-alanine ligase
MKPPAIAGITELRRVLDGVRRGGRSIGFVPTMGALHAGHGALMERARAECEYVVASIFVNPIQFERRDDFEAYKINLDADRELCGARGVDLVFAPIAEQMYPPGRVTYVDVEGLGDHLCGRFRPGHFRGVTTVVSKLFHIVQPDRAYFGEKDAQQLAIIERMVADLNFAIAIVPVPTVREPDGLALSSRNRRLSADERHAAPALYQALTAARGRLAEGVRGAEDVVEIAMALMRDEPRFRVEYLEVVDAATMQPVERISAPVRVAAAAWLGGTRLIDNVYFDPGTA